MKCVVYDIGGANIKRLLAEDDNGFVVLSSDIFYFPFWKRKDDFKEFLKELKVKADVTAVTMTAELCDCFANRNEGVKYITAICDAVLGAPFYLSTDRALARRHEVNDPARLAAANFVASLSYLEDNFDGGILLDMGSTTTDIVPFKQGKRLYGKTDLERLASGQLVYTGMLRTPVCAVVPEVPFMAGMTRTASEVFAIMADVYTILGQCDYKCETPDGRGKGVEDSMRRLARQLCADIEEVGEKELREISLYIREAQVNLIATSLRGIAQNEKLDTAYVCGIGKEVALSACAKAGLKAIDLASKTPAYDNLPCLGLAWMMRSQNTKR